MPCITSKGLTLVEVLVAITILSIGILGALALQTSTLQNSRSAYLRTQAIFAANDIANRMRHNKEAALSGHYNVDTDKANVSAPICVSSQAGCSATQLAQVDVSEWGANFKDMVGNIQNHIPVFPSGKGVVAQNNNNFTVTISWKETDWNQSAASVKQLVDKDFTLYFSL